MSDVIIKKENVYKIICDFIIFSFLFKIICKRLQKGADNYL